MNDNASVKSVNDANNKVENQFNEYSVKKHSFEVDNDLTSSKDISDKKENKNIVNLMQFDEQAQTNILMYLNGKTEANMAFVYDSGSSINVLNDELLFTSKISDVKGVNVMNSAGLYKITKEGDTMSFGKRFFDHRQFINILSEYSVIQNENIKVTTINDKDGNKIGYDLYIKDVDVTLTCRWSNGTMIGSFLPLIQKYNSLYAMRPAKSKINIKSMAKYEKAIGKAHKAMRRMGYQSKEEAAISISKGYIYNAPVNSRDFAYAADGFGPPKHFKLGAATTDSKLPYEDLVTECKENEVVLETDIGTFGRRQCLISKALPTHYGVVIPLGAKTKSHRPRSRKNLKKALVETINIISENGVKVKYILHDGEKSLAGNSLYLNELTKEIKDEYDVTLKPLPKDVRCKNVENLIKQWKSKGRQTNFALPYMIPPSMLDHLAIASIVNCDISPTTSDVNNAPPMALTKGKSIDYGKFCVSSFGEIVYTTENNGFEKSNIQLPRSRQCIYLYPTGTDGGHALLPVNNPKSGVIVRTLKATDVLKVTPIEVVVQLNRKALMERSKQTERQDKADKEKQIEEDELTGFQNDLLIDIDPTFSAAADSDIISIGETPGINWADREENQICFCDKIQRESDEETIMNMNDDTLVTAITSLYYTDCLAGGVCSDTGNIVNDKTYFQHEFIQSIDEIVLTTSWINVNKLDIWYR